MQHLIMASLFIPACMILACGSKKNEKNVPLVIANQSSDSTVQNTSRTDCSSDNPLQNQGCHLAAGEMQVLRQTSWVNPRLNIDGSLFSDDGLCLEKFAPTKADKSLQASLEINLVNMQLRNKAARCLMQIQVAYKKGYAFAIRKVEIPLIGQIPVDSLAVFDGSYGFQGKHPLVIKKTLEPRYSGKPLRLDHTVADQDIVWSSCSGQATLIVDTGMSLNFNGSEQPGDLQLEGKSPYRLEVVWAKCL